METGAPRCARRARAKFHHSAAGWCVPIPQGVSVSSRAGRPWVNSNWGRLMSFPEPTREVIMALVRIQLETSINGGKSWHRAGKGLFVEGLDLFFTGKVSGETKFVAYRPQMARLTEKVFAKGEKSKNRLAKVGADSILNSLHRCFSYADAVLLNLKAKHSRAPIGKASIRYQVAVIERD